MPGTAHGIKVEMVKGTGKTTPDASLIFTERFFEQSGLSKVINGQIGARRTKGASDSDHIKAMVMSQLCGGEAIEHQKHLRPRAGVLGVNVPSVSACRAYLQVFHNETRDKERGMGRSYIPLENEYLSGFAAVHAHMLKVAYDAAPLKEITLDQDATFIQTNRPGTCFNYKGERSYEAFSTYCPEYDVMAGTRYSDGNVPPGFEQLSELKRILSFLPEGVEKVKLRSGSAGYQAELMKYCGLKDNKRAGVIDFAISCAVCAEFKKTAKLIGEHEWKPIPDKDGLPSGQEWAEAAYAPFRLSKSKKDPEVRFFAIREKFRRHTNKKDNDNRVKGAPVQRELGLQMTDEIIEELEGGCEGLRASSDAYGRGNIQTVRSGQQYNG
jgi:hypothetical protein